MSRNFFISIIGLIVLLGAFSTLSFFEEQFSRAVHALTSPLWKGQSALAGKVGDILSAVESKHSLRKENTRLLDEMNRLKAEMLSLALLKKENDELRGHLGVERREQDVTLAFVLVRPNRSPYDTLLIDKGEEDGLKIGSLVSAPGGVAIGTVTSVSRQTAKVVLFSSPGEKSVVEIGASTLRVDATGQGGGNFEAKLPRGIEVHKGDLVSLIRGKRIILGVVEAIQAKPADSFQILLFKLPVNIYELEWVEIEKTPLLD
ncbi:MAG: rod shape-determining protein MreC [Parcubacteria group bacterium]|nr:rod shape-determining protein MreC [Parcubacteria group bacterium]